MKWKLARVPVSGKAKCSEYSAKTPVVGWDALVEPMTEFWTTLLDKIGGSKSPTFSPWDSVFIEMWFDGGRVIGYPGLRDRSKRIDAINVDLTSTWLETEYYRISDLESDGFSAAHRELSQGVQAVIRSALKSSSGNSVVSQLMSQHPFEAYVLEYDSVKTMQRLF